MAIYSSRCTKGLFRVNIVSILIFRDTCWPGLVSEFLPGLLELSGLPAVRGWALGIGTWDFSSDILALTSPNAPIR